MHGGGEGGRRLGARSPRGSIPSRLNHMLFENVLELFTQVGGHKHAQVKLRSRYCRQYPGNSMSR
jgi:hypothetical protein